MHVACMIGILVQYSWLCLDRVAPTKGPKQEWVRHSAANLSGFVHTPGALFTDIRIHDKYLLGNQVSRGLVRALQQQRGRSD